MRLPLRAAQRDPLGEGAARSVAASTAPRRTAWRLSGGKGRGQKVCSVPRAGLLCPFLTVARHGSGGLQVMDGSMAAPCYFSHGGLRRQPMPWCHGTPLTAWEPPPLSWAGVALAVENARLAELLFFFSFLDHSRPNTQGRFSKGLRCTLYSPPPRPTTPARRMHRRGLIRRQRQRRREGGARRPRLRRASAGCRSPSQCAFFAPPLPCCARRVSGRVIAPYHPCRAFALPLR